MKIIGHDDIIALDLQPQVFPEWINDALIRKSDSLLPPKLSIPLPGDKFYNTMPAVLPYLGLAGVKVVNRYPKREPALDSKILLFDLQSGLATALLDGNYITTWRTGAVAAHSADLLGVPDYTTVAFIGLGNTARATAQILAAKHPDRRFTFNLVRYKNQHELFAERLKKYPHVTCQYFDKFTDSIADADIVFSAVTVFHEDICEPEDFPPGVTLIPIHTRGFMACDLVFDKIFGDDYDQISSFKYFNQFKSFGEVAEVVRNEKPGRTSADERIIAYNIGIATHDLYFAHKILGFMPENTLTVDITSPVEKLWC